MISAAEQLREVSNETRTYVSDSTYRSKMKFCIDRFQTNYPCRNWHESLVTDYDSETEYQISVKHLIKWQKSDAAIIEEGLGVTLPQSIHAFYSEVETSVLTLRNLIWIKSPSEVVGFEKMHRDFEVEGGEQIQPVRLIRFAESLIDGICFAFRK